ncbi:MAG: NUDIX hydrolase [Candidatus Moraniibacteriota bacterium]
MHKSAGVIIENKKGEVLLIERAFYPPGWAAPAGHVDKGESFENAARREAEEEVGLKVGKLKLLAEEFVEWNECVKGIRGHDWKVFQAVDWEGEVEINKESKQFKWVKKKDLNNFELEEVWRHWFEKLGFLAKRKKQSDLRFTN